jgi:hypothetical protein
MAVLAPLLRAVGGAVALLFGRRVFWLFVAIVGFLAGFAIGQRLLPGSGSLVHILVGIGLGLVGALLSQAAPNLIAAIVGFLAGGYALSALVGSLVQLSNAIHWVLFIAGGLVGIYLAVKFFDLALVILSALSGAGALSALGGELLSFSGTIQAIVFVVLAAIGIAFQLGVVKPAKQRSK